MDEVQRGNALLKQGKAHEAERVYRAVLDSDPDDAQALAGLGNVLIRLGRDNEAWNALQSAARLDDAIHHAHSGLAWLALKRRDAVDAQRLAERALALDSGDSNGRFVLAQILFQHGRFAEAEVEFARAIELNGEHLEERNRLANEAFAASQFDKAARHYLAYAQLRKTDAKAWTNVGLSFGRLRNVAAASAALEKAIALAPNQAEPVAALASVLREAGANNATLIPVYRKLVQLAPHATNVLLHLARALIAETDYPQAKASLQQILRLEPDNLVALWLDFQRPDREIVADEQARNAFLSKWREGIARFESIDWRVPRFASQINAVLASTTDGYLVYLGQPLLDERRRNAAVVRKMLNAARPELRDVPIRKIGGKRRKVAVFSPSLLSHSVERVWAGSFLRLDQSEFELRAFCPAAGDGRGRDRWLARGIPFESGQRPAETWFQALQSFGPDVVVFLDIGMHQFVQAVSAMRHAPVQVTTWGHPASTGVPVIDYFLSGDIFEPADADAHYSEKLVRLPRMGVYVEPLDGIIERKPSWPGQPVQFLCTQSAMKLHPAHDELFARILQNNPNSRLIMLTSAQEHVAQDLRARMRPVFERFGIRFDARCEVHAKLAHRDYLQHLAKADVCLDSLDFSGGITSLDTLSANQPIVTLPGNLMRGRQTMGMLRLLGVEELIANSPDEYVAIATRLAEDASLRDALSERIRSRKSELFRDESAVTGLAHFLRTVEHPSVAD